MTHSPRVAIIVLNWNGKDDTLACLESLGQVTYPNFETIVVDNGSTDGSVAAVLMGGAVFLLQDTNLFLRIGCGAILYGGLLIASRAIDYNELRFMSGLLLRRTRGKKTA